MAWTSPRTWVAGEVVTAALMNTHVRDNLTFLKANPQLDGIVYVNDSANANMTSGLTVNQTTSDDEIVALKSSDVAHGVTSVAETDTFFDILKTSATAGGASLRGLTESTIGMGLQGIVTTAAQAKSTSADAAVVINGSLKSGTSVASLGTDGNILAIRDNGTTRFVFDIEGSAHADVEWTTFDTHDDFAFVDALDTLTAKDAVTNAFGEALRYNRADLEAAGIVRFYDDGPRVMLNLTRLHMLEVGALRQAAREIAALRARLEAIEGDREAKQLR